MKSTDLKLHLIPLISIIQFWAFSADETETEKKQITLDVSKGEDVNRSEICPFGLGDWCGQSCAVQTEATWRWKEGRGGRSGRRGVRWRHRVRDRLQGSLAPSAIHALITRQKYESRQ